MKLLKISLQNFRQFCGYQQIEFASKDQNITIIFGENGKGKTGIFRALMFGLYGSTHIQQDNQKDEIHLVNFIALEENLNMPVDAQSDYEKFVENWLKTATYEEYKRMKEKGWNIDSDFDMGGGGFITVDGDGDGHFSEEEFKNFQKTSIFSKLSLIPPRVSLAEPEKAILLPFSS